MSEKNLDPRDAPLSDPGTTARIGSGGSLERGHPVFDERGGEGKSAWRVTVTPIEGAGALGPESGIGLQLGGGHIKPRAIFEVRAEFNGPGIAPWHVPESQRLEHYHAGSDLELARGVAVMAVELLRAGGRDILLNVLAQRVKQRN